MNKKTARCRRAKRGRMKIAEQESIRLSVHRTPKHIYAQITHPNGRNVVVSASTLDKEVAKELKYTGNIDAAITVGKIVAERAIKLGIKNVAFDRSGFTYHGRVKALADAARNAGLEF